MSLEQAIAEQTAAIKENTTAMKELTAVWATLAARGQDINKGVEDGAVTAATAGNLKIPLASAPAEAEKVADPKPEAAVAPTPTAPETPAAKPETAAASPSEPISYDKVAKAITDGVKVSRDHVVSTLAKFGAKKGTELKAEQYADFLAAL